MPSLTVGPSARDFIWATGVENTFVPQTRPGHRSLDEFALMSHYVHWKEDLAIAKDLGVRAIRWGPPWYRVEPERGVFDWSWTDEVLPYIVEHLGLVPIADLMHYGCPLWLEREFANKNYPVAVADYAHAFVERYKSLVHFYTPLNEPVVNALMCGKRGLWPPYLRGEAGYIRIMLQLAQGIVRTCRVIRDAHPGATLVFVEATGLSRAAQADLEPLAVEDQHRAYLCFDLVTGRVTPQHPLYTTLLRHGATPTALDQFVKQPVKVDVLGMNFYPQWSVKQLYINRNGRIASRVFEGGTSFSSLIHDYYERYRVPIMITETSAFGSDEVRSTWLRDSLAAIRKLREGGVPVYGYTWFPMHTMIDWRYRLGSLPVENYRIELGFYELRGGDFNPRWHPTSLVAQFKAFADDPLNSIGEMENAPMGLCPTNPGRS